MCPYTSMMDIGESCSLHLRHKDMSDIVTNDIKRTLSQHKLDAMFVVRICRHNDLLATYQYEHNDIFSLCRYVDVVLSLVRTRLNFHK